MRITNVRVEENESSISLRADCKIRPVGEDVVYFTFDKKYKDFLYEDASPFAAALLIPSMYRGEDLIVEGVISEELHRGMHHIMDVLLGWKLQGLRRVKIVVQNTVKDTTRPRYTGSFFSGGVDSFYTYLKHKKDAQDPISHFILVHGNDIDLRNKRLWEGVYKDVSAVAEKGGVKVVAVETNVQALLEPMVSPDFTHGASLAAVGLAIRSGFKKIYIPSTFNAEQQVPYGSHPDTDKYWGTERTHFEHDGVEASRLKKIEWEVARSPLALEYLRVCYMNKKGAYNCGTCEKCLRTMIGIYIAGKLGEAKTFPHTIDLARLTTVVSQAGFGPVMQNKENLAELKKKNLDPAMQKALEEGLANVVDLTQTPKDRIYRNFFYFDHLYFRGILHRMWMGVVHPY